jgi:beta-glucosidase
MPSQEHERLFPPGFWWGTATSAHQVDGGNIRNNWWDWEQTQGKIRNGDRSGIACDHWHRYSEDFDLLHQLHQNAYRFSFEWSRIIPEKGKIDDAAIHHYHRVVSELKKRRIEPFVTLHHFTEPLWVTKLGGIRRKRNIRFFREYVEVVASEFSKEVTYWNTINEPNIRAAAGYFQGIHPPGETGLLPYLEAIRNIIRMHADAYSILKAQEPRNIVGLVKNISIFEPGDATSWQDRLLARLFDYLANGVTLRALKTGKLPLAFFQTYTGLKGSSDFIGLNYYSRLFCSRRFPELLRGRSDDADPTRLCAGLGWEAYPEGLYFSLKRLWRELQVPIVITENGIGTDDDQWRQEFLLQHLYQVHRAIHEGVPVKGYFHWSFIDNFEWTEGYASRFGLVDCNRKTLKRTIKKSGYLYAKIAQENTLPSDFLFQETALK